MLKKHGVFYSSEIPEITWYEPLYNTLGESRCVFVLGPSSPCNSFSILLTHAAFLLYSFCFHILLQNCFSPLTSSLCEFSIKVSIFLCILYQSFHIFSSYIQSLCILHQSFHIFVHSPSKFPYFLLLHPVFVHSPSSFHILLQNCFSPLTSSLCAFSIKFPYFAPKLFFSSDIQSLCILHQIVGRIFFIVLKSPVLSVLFYSVSISF